MGAGKRVLVANVQVGDRLFLAGESPEKEYADQITNPKAWGGDEAGKTEKPADPPADPPAPSGNEGGGDNPPAPEAPDYEGMKPDELAVMAEARKVAVTGTGKDGNVLKKDYVAALKADDAAKS